MRRKTELNSNLSLCTRVNSRWIKDLEIRPETLQLLEEGTGPTLQHVGTGRYFLNKTAKAQEIKLSQGEPFQKHSVKAVLTFWCYSL